MFYSSSQERNASVPRRILYCYLRDTRLCGVLVVLPSFLDLPSLHGNLSGSAGIGIFNVIVSVFGRHCESKFCGRRTNPSQQSTTFCLDGVWDIHDRVHNPFKQVMTVAWITVPTFASHCWRALTKRFFFLRVRISTSDRRHREELLSIMIEQSCFAKLLSLVVCSL